ncbi:MAG: flagellar biosynthesis anti-sigma factor FlgM [Acidobacteria bacterium]|nr:flagellar biosynthesis anti-sigma factor FlgM [Acidobacteriota bacterium]
MKVDNPYTTPGSPVDLVGQDSARRTAPKAVVTAGPDRVQLSGDLRLAKAAVQAANTQPEIRQDAVNRAKALLERDELGHDVDRLADAMLAALTIPYDDDPA